MSIASEIQRIKDNIKDTYIALSQKGATLPVNQNTDNLSDCVATIPTGTPINNQDITVYANGSYEAEEGYTGLGRVIVDVPSPINIDYINRTYSDDIIVCPNVIDNISRTYSDNIEVYESVKLDSNLTQTGSGITDYITGEYIGSTNSYIYYSNTLALSTADNWEFQTKYKYTGGGGGCPHLLGYTGGNHYQAPLLLLESTANPKLFAAISSNGSSWDITNNPSLSSLTMTVNETYYIKFGFSGTEYYIDYNTTGWSDTFTRCWTVTDSTKCYCNEPFTLMNGTESPSTDWSGGPMNLPETRFYINSSLVFTAATSSQQVYP